jgi:hypothetical protein
MPNKKRPLNLEIVRSNLAEAIEEPQKLERRAETGDLHEEGLQVGLCHARHHHRKWVGEESPVAAKWRVPSAQRRMETPPDERGNSQ